MMKNLFKLALCGLVFALAACTKSGVDDNGSKPTGITYKSCPDKMDIKGDAHQEIITITAEAAWTATVSQTRIATISSGASGEAGTHDIVLDFTANETAYERNLTLSVKVEGVEQKITICRFTQLSINAKGSDEKVNRSFTWPYLERYYLWNKDLRDKGAPKFDQAYDDFLDSALKSISTNGMDGYWYTNNEGQKVWYYYSYIQRTTQAAQNATRATKTMYQGYGVSAYTLQFYQNSNDLHYAVEYVYPGSAAETAGLKRGDFIGKVNGTTVNMSNYANLILNTFYYEVPVGTTCELEVYEFDWNTQDLTKTPRIVTMTSTTYFENPVLFYDIYSYRSTKDDTKSVNVGYMVYNSFDAAFDDEIDKAFDSFAEAAAEMGSIDYMILDLRYNGGGNVASCCYLSSLIAGDKALEGGDPKVFMYSRYNDERMSEQGRNKNDYTTYKKDEFDDNAAMKYNFPFKEVYVIGTYDTASSSEMLINALRGIGVKVTLVGGTTNGKNVGMEVWNTQNLGAIDGNHYIFAPISFQSYNCLGESNYDNGFTPEGELNCAERYEGMPPVDWGIYYIEGTYEGQQVYYLPDYFSRALDDILAKEFPVSSTSLKRVTPRETMFNKQIRRIGSPMRKQDVFRSNAWVLAEE